MLPSTMKALIKSKPGVSYSYEDVPVPKPKEGELLVKVGKVALCGSDIALYQWNEGLSSYIVCDPLIAYFIPNSIILIVGLHPGNSQFP